MKKATTVEHVSVDIKSSFDRFTFRLEKALGILQPSLLKALGAVPSSMANYLHNTQDENQLILFNIFSHEDISDKENSRKIKQYQVGVPRIICRMISRSAAAGLYYPLKLLVYEKPDLTVVVEYDSPSSLFGRFDNADILSDSMILENNLIKLILVADGEDTEDDIPLTNQ